MFEESGLDLREVHEIYHFSRSSRLALGDNQRRIQWAKWTFRREADHLYPPGA